MKITLAAISPRGRRSKSEAGDRLVDDYIGRTTRYIPCSSQAEIRDDDQAVADLNADLKAHISIARAKTPKKVATFKSSVSTNAILKTTPTKKPGVKSATKKAPPKVPRKAATKKKASTR